MILCRGDQRNGKTELGERVVGQAVLTNGWHCEAITDASQAAEKLQTDGDLNNRAARDRGSSVTETTDGKHRHKSLSRLTLLRTSRTEITSEFRPRVAVRSLLGTTDIGSPTKLTKWALSLIPGSLSVIVFVIETSYEGGQLHRRMQCGLKVSGTESSWNCICLHCEEPKKSCKICFVMKKRIKK